MTNHVVYDHVIITVGALAAKAAATGASKVDGSRLQGVDLAKMNVAMSYDNKTTLQGPLVIGLALALSAAEIAEALDADPQSSLDEPAQEQSRRRVFPIWHIPRLPTGSDRTHVLKNVRFPWKRIPEDMNLFWFAFNAGAGGMTTGTVVQIEAALVGTWRND